MKRTTVIMTTPDSSSEASRKCVDSIKRFTKDYELIIIDNVHDRNFNYAKENNRAIMVSEAEYILLINDDILVTEGWLKKLINCAEQHHLIGIVGPKMVRPDGSIDHAGGFIHPFKGYAPVRIGHFYDDWTKESRPVQYVCDACILLKRKLIEDVGFLDERYLMNYEDVDLCVRAWESGYKVFYTPRSIVVHEHWTGVKKERPDATEVRGTSSSSK